MRKPDPVLHSAHQMMPLDPRKITAFQWKSFVAAEPYIARELAAKWGDAIVAAILARK